MSRSGAAYGMPYGSMDAVLFVTTSGSDSNDGKSPGTAKATVGAAYAALPSTGGLIQLSAGTFSLPTTGTNGLSIANKPVAIRGVGKVRTVLSYAGTGAAIRIGVGESVSPFLDWGWLEDFTITTTNVSNVRGIVIDGAHRGSITRVEVAGTNNMVGSIGFELFDGYQNYFTDCLSRGYFNAVYLHANSNDVSFLNTSMDSAGIVCQVTDSTGVRIRGGQISGTTAPAGVQVDAIAQNVTGFELTNVYFDTGTGGVTQSFKLGPAATSPMQVLSPTIISNAGMGGIVDKVVAATLIVSNIVSGHSLTLTNNCSDAWVRYYLSGGTFSDSGTRNTIVTPNGSKQYVKNATANDTNFGFKHSATGGQSLWFETAGDTNPSFTCTAQGFMAWGAGGAAGTDTTLQRVAVNAAKMLVINRGFRTQVVTTATRPSAVDAGVATSVYDQTINKQIWSDGTVWRDATGTAV